MVGECTIEEASWDLTRVPLCIQQTSTMRLALGLKRTCYLAPPCLLIHFLTHSFQRHLCQVPCNGSFLIDSVMPKGSCAGRPKNWIEQYFQRRAAPAMFYQDLTSAWTLSLWQPPDSPGPQTSIVTAYLSRQIGSSPINSNTAPLGFFLYTAFSFKTHFPMVSLKNNNLIVDILLSTTGWVFLFPFISNSCRGYMTAPSFSGYANSQGKKESWASLSVTM